MPPPETTLINQLASCTKIYVMVPPNTGKNYNYPENAMKFGGFKLENRIYDRFFKLIELSVFRKGQLTPTSYTQFAANCDS